MPASPSGISTIPILLILSCFYSCSDNKASSEELKQIETSLMNSNEVIDMSTQRFLKDLEEKAVDPPTAERGKPWLAKAKQISKLAKGSFDYIESIKLQLKEEKPIKDSIEDRMSRYKQALMEVDSTIRLEFRDRPEFTFHLERVPTSNMLAALQNNIKVIENRIIAYCNTKVGNTWDGFFDYYYPIVGQSSNQVAPGSTIEIVAGIGHFSKSAQPKITINGRLVELAPEGVATYKMKVRDNPGKYYVPVKISYTDKISGKEEIREVNVEYAVAKPCDDQN